MDMREFTRRLVARLRKEGFNPEVQETELTRDLMEGEQALRSLLVGGHFCEAHFYGELVLVISRFDQPDRKDAQVTIGDRWILYPSEPELWPTTVDQLPERTPDASMEELVGLACELREQAIVDVRLGPLGASLRLNFDDGRVLFVNGSNPKYESWTVTAGKVSVVAVPGELLGVWT